MLHYKNYKPLGLLISMFMWYGVLNAQTIEVVFTDIRSTQGQIKLDIFLDEESFKAEKPLTSLKFKKTTMVNGEMKVKFNLGPGTYGFALLDDENNNGEMNYNFVGMPKEGFGFSNYYLTKLSRPKFDEFKFTTVKGQSYKILMKLKYM